MEERRNDERRLFSVLRLETGVGGGREGKEQSEYDHSTLFINVNMSNV